MRLSTSVLTAIIALTFLAARPGTAQQYTAPVVARVEMQLAIDDESVDTIEKGDLLTVLREDEDTVLILTHNGQRGIVDKVNALKLEESVEIYDELIEEFPREGRYYTLRASAWLARGDQIAALNDYDKAIETGYEEAHAYASRGAFHAMVGNLEEATDDYTEAIASEPDVESYFISRAAVYQRQKEFDRAIEDYTSALKLKPRTSTYQQRAIAWKQKGNSNKAIDDFTASLKINPDHIPSLMGRGFLSFQMGDAEKAIEDFSAVISINPKAAEAWNNRGFNRQLLGQFSDALQDYRKATELAPKYSLAWTNTAWLLSTCYDDDIRDGKKALEAATQACELTDFQEFNALKALAAAHAESGDFEKAIGWQEKAIEHAPESAIEHEKKLLAQYGDEKPFRVLPKEDEEDASDNEGTVGN